jgi:hypothetical protein
MGIVSLVTLMRGVQLEKMKYLCVEERTRLHARGGIMGRQHRGKALVGQLESAGRVGCLSGERGIAGNTADRPCPPGPGAQ